MGPWERESVISSLLTLEEREPEHVTGSCPGQDRLPPHSSPASSGEVILEPCFLLPRVACLVSALSVFSPGSLASASQDCSALLSVPPLGVPADCVCRLRGCGQNHSHLRTPQALRPYRPTGDQGPRVELRSEPKVPCSGDQGTAQPGSPASSVPG